MAATLIPCPVDRAECSPRSFDVGMQTAPRTMAKHSELNTDLAWHASGWLERSIVAWILPHHRHRESGFPESTQVEIVLGVYGKPAWQY